MNLLKLLTRFILHSLYKIWDDNKPATVYIVKAFAL